MNAPGLVRDLGRAPARVGVYTIEYTSSERHGIVMYSEEREATSATDALAYAKTRLSGMAAKYGARGYRVKGADGVFTQATNARPDE